MSIPFRYDTTEEVGEKFILCEASKVSIPFRYGTTELQEEQNAVKQSVNSF